MTPAEIVARALAWRDKSEYQLGTGNYNPNQPDSPETVHHKTGKRGADCAGFAVCFAHKLRRHRPGFGRGPGARVVDDLNSDSVLYDAIHNQELFELVIGPPNAGDLLIMPSTYDRTGERTGIGHVMLAIANRAREWQHDLLPRPWGLVDVAQCRGPNGKRPGIIVSDASVCARHDAKWVKKPDMWTQVVRCRPEILANL